MKTGAIIQARMGSTRLKGKTLKILLNKPVLAHIIDRIKESQYCHEIIVASTVNPEDNEIESYLEGENVKCFRGDEEDVLDRFYKCAKHYDLDLIVRVTADDPFKDPNVIDQAIEIMLSNRNLDYCSNTIEPTFPEGIDVEVFTIGALERAYNEANLKSEREHVTPYIWKNPRKFRVRNFKYTKDLSQWRWTLDNEQDWKFVETVYKHLFTPGTLFYMEDIIELLEKFPSISEINNQTKRNEGYLKSLEDDVDNHG